MRPEIKSLISALALAALPPAPVVAEETKTAATGLHLELNRLEQNGAACRASLIARNGFAADLDQAAFELVMFDQAGLITLMTAFDFGSLPTGKTVVRRFDIPETGCNALSRILVNGVARCDGEGVDTQRCQTGFSTSNRTEIEFGH